MKKSSVFAALAVLCFASAVGVAGANDLFGMGLGWLVLRLGGGLIGFVLFTCFAQTATIDEAREAEKQRGEDNERGQAT